jgi:hypothetical protein
MATTTNPKAAPGAAVGGDPGVGARVLHCLYVKQAVAANPSAADIIELGWLPKGAVPVGGYLSTTDMDTGVETLDIDIGIAANGVDSADPDFFTNSGLLSGDAIATDLPLTNAANLRPFTAPFPVEQLGAKTKVQAVVNAVAATFAAGTFVVAIYYTMPGLATS